MSVEKIIEYVIALVITTFVVAIALTLTMGLEHVLASMFGLTLEHLITAFLGILAFFTIRKEL
tara:strand:+ start:329 stop:517 length:189 start_codon:yes stop_codon:yes gene_type:complete